MTWAGRLSACLLAVCLASCALRITRVADEDGQQLYRDACAACHGMDGRGNGPAAAALRAPPTDLTELSRRHGGTFPRSGVIQVITEERPVAAHGDRQMPVWSQRFAPSGTGATAAAAIYARQQVELLVNYIESLQRNVPR